MVKGREDIINKYKNDSARYFTDYVEYLGEIAINDTESEDVVLYDSLDEKEWRDFSKSLDEQLALVEEGNKESNKK